MTDEVKQQELPHLEPNGPKEPRADAYEITHEPFKITLLSVMGKDEDVGNIAHVSVGTEDERKFNEDNPMGEKEKQFIRRLARLGHMSPFRHAHVQFRIEAPEFVMRQLYKHVVGIEGTADSTTKDHAWNERSGRYVPYAKYYLPLVWNSQSKSMRQCSGGPIGDTDPSSQRTASQISESTLHYVATAYHTLLEMGVSKEQARMILPMTTYTTVIWTASLQAIHNVVILRDSKHAQEEIRLLAQEMSRLVLAKFPIAFGALLENIQARE